MPGIRTAAELVLDVRQELGVFDKVKLVDGYGDEVPRYAPANSILRALNRALNELCKTGFNKCRYEFTLTAGTSEYLFSRQMHDLHSSYLLDNVTPTVPRYYPLDKVTIPDLDNAYGGTWRNVNASRPLFYYPIGTRAFGVYPTPTLTTLKAGFIAESVVSDMTQPTDYPAQIFASDGITMILEDDGGPASSLPEEFHELLPIGASARLARSIGDMERATSFFQQWSEYVRDLRGLVNSRLETEITPINIETPRRYQYGYHTGFLTVRTRL